MSSMRLPPRITIAIVATVLALVVLAGNALLGGDDDGDGDRAGPTETTTSSTSTSAPPVGDTGVTATSAVLAPDWYPKGSSTFSDRRPQVTVTTLPSTTTSSTLDGG